MAVPTKMTFMQMNDSTITLSIMFIISLVCYAVFYNKRKRVNELVALMPSVPGLPIIGNILQFRGSALDITNYMKKIIKSCMHRDGIVAYWFGSELQIVLINPNDVQIVLNKELTKGTMYRFMKPSLGEGLVSAELSIWKVHRKLMALTFHQKILDVFIDIFVEKSEVLAKKLTNVKGTFDAVHYLKPCTYDIVTEAAMGVNIHAQKSIDVPYIQSAIGLIEIVNKRIFKWWLRPDWLYVFTPYAKQEKDFLKTVHSFTNNVVLAKKDNYFHKHNDIKVNKERDLDRSDFFSQRKNILDHLIDISETGARLTDKELKDEVETLIIAGTDTTAQAVSFTLLMLGSHQSIQDEVFKELYEIFGDSERHITKDDLLEMKYLERVIKETLRLFPIAPLIMRQLNNEVKIEKYTLPIGAGCVIGTYAIHRNPAIWGENAEEFDPDNFLPEKCEKRHPYAYIPFSGGPRNCIGKQFAMMSMKVMLATIIRMYKIHSDADHKAIWKNEIIFEIFTKPIGGFPISVEPRIINAI